MEPRGGRARGGVLVVPPPTSVRSREWVQMYGGDVPPEARWLADSVAASGGTPLLVAVHDWDGPRVLGLIHLKDVVKDGIRERFAKLRRMGIRTVMITGDNPLPPTGVDAHVEARPQEEGQPRPQGRPALSALSPPPPLNRGAGNCANGVWGGAPGSGRAGAEGANPHAAGPSLRTGPAAR